MCYEQVIERLREDIRAAANSDDVLVMAVQTSCKACQIPYGEVWAPYALTPALVLVGAWYHPGTDKAAFVEASRKLAFAPGVGLPGRVWQSRKPEAIKDIRNHVGFTRRSLALSAGFGRVVGLPIVAGGDLVAVMVFFDVPSGRQPPEVFEGIANAVSAELTRRRAGTGPWRPVQSARRRIRCG